MPLTNSITVIILKESIQVCRTDYGCPFVGWNSMSIDRSIQERLMLFVYYARVGVQRYPILARLQKDLAD